MSDLSPELNLALAVDDDDTADYLDGPTNSLRSSLLILDGLFNAASGHAHNGSHQGGALQFQNLTVGQDLTVNGASLLKGPVHANSNLLVDGDTTLTTLTVNSTSHLIGAVTIDGAINSSGTLTIGQDLTVGRDLRVNRNAVIVGTLNVTGLSTFSGGLTTGGGALAVGSTTITGNLSVSGSISTGGISSADWFRVSTAGYGIFNSAVNQGIGIGASGPVNYANGQLLLNMGNASVAPGGNTLALRDGNGYLQASYISYTGDVQGGRPTHVLGRTAGDNYLRWWPANSIGPPSVSRYMQGNLSLPALSNSGGTANASVSAVANSLGAGIAGGVITVPYAGYYSVSGGFNGNNLTGNQEQLEMTLISSVQGQLDFLNCPLKISSYFGGYFSWQGFMQANESVRLQFHTAFDSINGAGEIMVTFIPVADYPN